MPTQGERKGGCALVRDMLSGGQKNGVQVFKEHIGSAGKHEERGEAHMPWCNDGGDHSRQTLTEGLTLAALMPHRCHLALVGIFVSQAAMVLECKHFLERFSASYLHCLAPPYQAHGLPGCHGAVQPTCAGGGRGLEAMGH